MSEVVESQDIILGVRPDHNQIASKGIDGKVDVSELMGTSSHLHMSVLGKDTIAIVPNDGEYIDYKNKDVKVAFNGNVVHEFSKENEKNLEN